jgi:hypothetical protein
MPYTKTTPLALAACLALSSSSASAQHSSARADTVRISRTVLARALNDAVACRSPDAGRGFLTTPIAMLQAGDARVLSDGRIVVMDVDESAMRIYATDGRQLARFGRKGAGPGEFGARASPMEYGRDTIAVSDPTNARIQLFTSSGYAQSISIAGVGGRFRNRGMGRGPDGGFLYPIGVDFRTDLGRPYRAPLTLGTWRPGTTLEEVHVVRDSILSVTMQYLTDMGYPTYSRANMQRITNAAAFRKEVVIYDDARPVIDIVDWNGRLQRVIVFDIVDPPVSAANRDSIARYWAQFGPPRSKEMDDQHAWFPATRPAATWAGYDHGDGFWLAFSEPMVKGPTVFVRVTTRGILSQCYRVSDGVRVAAFGPDRVVTVAERDDGDVINVERSVSFPQINSKTIQRRAAENAEGRRGLVVVNNTSPLRTSAFSAPLR